MTQCGFSGSIEFKPGFKSHFRDFLSLSFLTNPLSERLSPKLFGQQPFDLPEKVETLINFATSTKTLIEQIGEGIQYSINNITSVMNVTK